MGMGKGGKAHTPPAPEPVKYTDQESAETRDKARQEASRRFGLLSTDLTHGAVGETEAGGVKKKKLGE